MAAAATAADEAAARGELRAAPHPPAGPRRQQREPPQRQAQLQLLQLQQDKQFEQKLDQDAAHGADPAPPRGVEEPPAALCGIGRFGQVFAAELALSDGKGGTTSRAVALKFAQRTDHAENERAALELLHFHPNIVSYYGSWLEEDANLVLALELCTEDFYTQFTGKSLRPRTLTRYARELAHALRHIHSFNIVHGDIKAENVMLGKDGHLRVIDFGMAIFLDSPDEKVITAGGTLHYAAPELLRRQPHGVEVDWWSAIVLLHELAFGELPFGIGELDAEADAMEICMRICTAPLLLPYEVEHEADLDSDFQVAPSVLDNLFRSGLAKRPSERTSNFESVMALIPAV